MFFSVIVPTCGRLDMLQRAISSLDAQTYKDFEVVIIDDMKEGTLDLSAFDYKNLDIVIVKNTGEHGVSRARNLGIARAKGQWICFLDDDDEFSYDYLSVLHENIESDETIDLYWCGVRVKLNPQEHKKPLRELLPYKNEDVFTIGISYGVVIKSSVLTRYGYFNDEFIVGEDTELLFRLLDNNILIKPIKMIGVIKDETHTNRLSSGYKIYSEKKVYERLFDMYLGLLQKHKKMYFILLCWSTYVHFINKNYHSSASMLGKMIKTCLLMVFRR